MRPPRVLGHEGTGVVEEVGAEVTAVAVGDRVIGSFIPACGVCWFCLHDQSNLCEQHLHGDVRAAGASAPTARRSSP